MMGGVEKLRVCDGAPAPSDNHAAVFGKSVIPASARSAAKIIHSSLSPTTANRRLRRAITGGFSGKSRRVEHDQSVVF